MSALTVAPFEGTPAEWDAFARAHPASTHCHLWGWRRVVEAAYGHDCPYLAARGADGALAGILPLVDVRTLALGRFLVSMPFLNYGGPLGTPEAEHALVERAAALARERRAKLLELRCAGEVGGGLPASHDKITVVLDLAEGGPDAVWKGFSSKLRSQVRKPEKEGVTMAFGADQVEPFFRVFARHMRDLGTPTHPLSFFAAVAAELGEAAWFGCAYRGGEPVAGGCAVRMGDSVELVWASALREHAAAAPNMLLYWEFIRRAVEEGAARFDFGRCTPGSSTHRFKRQWGARDLPLWWYRDQRAADAATPSPDRGAFALATRVWKRVPVPLATLLGPRIRGAIPQ